jgi:membrane fusion protein (multidrug efflux system)
VQKDEPIVMEWVGTLDGFVNADIRAQVSGYLGRQAYTDGAPVKKGDLLFEIDARPFQATYDEVKANFDKSELDLKRQSELLATQAAARQDYDDALAAQLAAKAALEQAQLNLQFTRVVSPIDGLAGIATAQLGDLVGPATGVLTTVSTVDPIKVYFSITEGTYLDFTRERPGQPKYPQDLELHLILSDGSTYPLAGKFYAADRAIDAGTGTLRLAGVFPNPHYLLRPGQYAKVRAVIRTIHGALLVPQIAVAELQGAYQVATVDGENHAHLRTVTVGDRVGPLWIISQGVQPGDRVVTEGFQKVKEGMVVNPRPAAGK